MEIVIARNMIAMVRDINAPFSDGKRDLLHLSPRQPNTADPSDLVLLRSEGTNGRAAFVYVTRLACPRHSGPRCAEE